MKALSNNNPEIKISVILPVYNVEGFIDACITSLKAQTLQDLEFIFVDDCGKDNSMRLVESWAMEDSRVRIIRNPHNLGTGPSRNKGIESARGEYLSFVDPDDRLESNFYDMLFKKATISQVDIVKGIRIKECSGSSTQTKTIRRKQHSALNNQIRKSQRHHVPLYCVFTFEHQSAIYKRSLFSIPSVRYGNSRNSQDTTFLLRATISEPSIELENRAIYYYCQRESGATAFYSKKRAFEELLSFKEKLDTLSDPSLSFLSDKNYSQYYLIAMLSGYYANACYSRKTCDWAEEDEVRYIELLQGELMRLDAIFSQKDYLKHCAELKAMKEYRAWISPINRMLGFFNTERLQAWTDFLIQHPNADRIFIKGFSDAIAHSILEYAYHRIPSSLMLSSEARILNDGNKAVRPLRFVSGSLGQLSSKQKTAILYSLPGSFLFCIRKKLLHLLFGFA